MTPIKGISEIIRLPLLGKINLGTREKDADGNIYPSPTDYFVCPDEVKKVFGEKPKEIRIMFPTEDREQWASQYLRCYSDSGNLLCRGDGETALAKVETLTGEADSIGSVTSKLVEIPCNPSICPCHQHDYCRRVMNLQFLLPECPGFGVYQLDTSSYHSMRNINAMLKLIDSVCQRVSMIPLSLQLIEHPVQPDGFDKVVYVLKLNCHLSLIDAQKFAQIPRGKALLPPPDSKAPDDLFPQIKQVKSDINKKTSNRNEEMLELWIKAKSKINHHDIQNDQIARWFEKNFHIIVRLKDFEPVSPPARITSEMLDAFCQAVDQYTR